MQMNGCRHLVPLYPYHATNYKRESSTTEENAMLAVRVSEDEMEQLAAEYNEWRGRRDGISANIDVSYSSMFQFLTYLARGGYFQNPQPY